MQNSCDETAPVRVNGCTNDVHVAEVEGIVLGTRRVGARVAFADIYIGPPGSSWAVSWLVEVVIKVGAPAIYDSIVLSGACRDIIRPGNLVRLQGSWCASHTSDAHGCVDQVCRLELVTRWADARPGCMFRRPTLGEEVPDLRVEQAFTIPGRHRGKGGQTTKTKAGDLDRKKNQRLLPCTPVVVAGSPPPRAWMPVLELRATPRFSTWSLLPHRRSADGCIVHATVPGFEEVCIAEFRDKLGLPGTAVSAVPGHVSCDLGALDVGAAVARLLSLKSVEHLYASLFDGTVSDLQYTEGDNASAGLYALRSAIQSVAPETWHACLKVWREAFRSHREGTDGDAGGIVSSSLEDEDMVTAAQTFKVEKQRVGKHSFSSTELAQHAYLAVADKLGPKWQGVLENPDLTVVVKVKGAHLFVGIPLTRRGEVLWKQQACGVGCEDEAPVIDGEIGRSDDASNEVPSFEQRSEQLHRNEHVQQQLQEKHQRRQQQDEEVEEKEVEERPQQLLRHADQQPPRAWVDTPLRPTVAYGLVQASGPLVCGDVLVDPCCGCGTISEVAAQEYPRTVFCLSGDFDTTAVACAAHNVRRLFMSVNIDTAPHGADADADTGNSNVSSKYERRSSKPFCTGARPVLIDVVQWDSTRLPLRAGVVDRLVTDLPFGKRSGSRSDNNDRLYPALFAECARVLRREPTTQNDCFARRTKKQQAISRVVLMSADRSSLKRSLERMGSANNAKIMAHVDKMKPLEQSKGQGGLNVEAVCDGEVAVKARVGEAASLRLHAEHHVNMGGLNADVYVLGEASNRDTSAAEVDGRHKSK